MTPPPPIPHPHLSPRKNLQPVCQWSVLWSLLFSVVNDSEVPVVWGIFSTLTWMDLMKWTSANKKHDMAGLGTHIFIPTVTQPKPNHSSELRQPWGPVISALIWITQSGLVDRYHKHSKKQWGPEPNRLQHLYSTINVKTFFFLKEQLNHLIIHFRYNCAQISYSFYIYLTCLYWDIMWWKILEMWPVRGIYFYSY